MLNAATISRMPPLGKLALWAAGVAALLTATQLAMAVVGADFSVLDKSGGSGLVIAVALGGLLVMMAIESRSPGDYGLVVDAQWWRRARTGAAIGAGFYLAYLLLACWAGPLVLGFEQTTPSRGLKAALAALSAAPIAVTQQIIFSGYLLTTIRDRHAWPLAVLGPAVLFGVATGAPVEGGLFGPTGWRLFVGMLLVQTLLGLLRLRTGSIVLPAGVLAGAIAVRKIASKSRVLSADWQHPDLGWIAPAGDPRQGPALWGLLGVATLAMAFVVWRHGERRLEADAGIDASFKRYMPFSNLLGLAPLDRWAALLWQARFRVGIRYVPRLVMTLLGSAISTVLSLPERLLAPLLLRHESPPPVFLVGMHRSGTTHLHNLLSLDPQFRSPRNHEAFNPHGFLTGWLTTALLTPLLTWRRPMDSVQMTVFSAQEEEFALATMGSPSPYWSFCLPREIDRHDRYARPEGFTNTERRRWGRHYRLLLRKLTFRWWGRGPRRTPLLKNPANTGRVAMLRELFPGAKFVHIVRHPHAVWRSNQRFAEHGLAVFQLQDPRPDDNYATRTLANYRRGTDAFYADTQDAPPGDVAEVRFEDLEADPKAALLEIYRELGMTPSAEFAPRLEAYLDGVRGYRKNRFKPLAEADQAEINRVMAPYFEEWGYDPAPSVAGRAA